MAARRRGTRGVRSTNAQASVHVLMSSRLSCYSSTQGRDRTFAKSAPPKENPGIAAGQVAGAGRGDGPRRGGVKLPAPMRLRGSFQPSRDQRSPGRPRQRSARRSATRAPFPAPLPAGFDPDVVGTDADLDEAQGWMEKQLHRRKSASAKVSERGYSITSSARARSASGTVKPSAFAAFRLMTSSNRVGRWIGSSAGSAPLRMRSA